MTFTIKHGLIIKAKPSIVYEAVSQAKHLNNWWTLESESKAVLGEDFRLYFGPEYDWLAVVQNANQANAFEVKMKRTMKDWEATSFGFKLEPKDENTQVSFYHRGWETDGYHFQNTSYCWALLLKGLKDYVEKGIIIPFEKRA